MITEKAGIFSLTETEIIKKALRHKYDSLMPIKDNRGFHTKPIKTYWLTDEILKTLASQGIVQQSREDKVFTLMDQNPQEQIPRFRPSNYWNFGSRNNEEAFDLTISLSFDLVVSTKERGVIFFPITHASLVSPTDPLPNFRMFKILTENDETAHTLTKEIARSDGKIIVMWNEIGLGGIRKLADLFAEFAKSNKSIIRLSKKEEVFDPDPKENLFIEEHIQPRVFKTWQEQLEEYRNSLIV